MDFPASSASPRGYKFCLFLATQIGSRVLLWLAFVSNRPQVSCLVPRNQQKALFCSFPCLGRKVMSLNWNHGKQNWTGSPEFWVLALYLSKVRHAVKQKFHEWCGWEFLTFYYLFAYWLMWYDIFQYEIFKRFKQEYICFKNLSYNLGKIMGLWRHGYIVVQQTAVVIN